MICDSQNAYRARTGLAAFAVFALAGSASGQIDTRNWLLPQSGLWSDTANWSDANVPDSASEIARLSPGAAVPPGSPITAPIALVDGLFEILRLEGNGSVEVFIDEGSDLIVTDGVVDGTDGGILAITLGSSLGDHTMPSILTLGNGAGRQTAVRSTSIHMIGENGNTSVIDGGLDLLSSSSLEGQGVIESIANYGEVVVKKVGNGSGELRITGNMSNRGTLTIEPTGHLIFENCNLAQLGDIVNQNLITVVGGRITGIMNGNIDWFDECTISNGEFLNGYSNVDGVLTVSQNTGYFAGNVFSLHNGAEMKFTDTVFLQGKTTFSGPRREIVFEPATISPRVSAPEGETIVAMPGYVINGAGVIDADFLNFGTLKPNRGLSLNALEETLEIHGEFTQTSSGLIEIAIDPGFGNPVADRIVIRDGDADLDGPLFLNVHVNFDNDPFNQIAIVNRDFTIISLDDAAGMYSITGQFSNVSTQLLDDRLSRYPDVNYHDDRVDVRFYCRADVNRNGTVEPADFTAWLSAYQNGSLLADMTGNGVLTSADFTKWVDLFNRGCPN